MGYLINAWNETQRKFTMNLKQIVNIAGDEYLESEEAVQELRDFFSLIDISTMGRLCGECFSKDRKLKFDARGFAFQDLINEMGIRLGFKVEHGLYKGKKNEIGYDGLWKTQDGTFIVMESKATGDYAFSPETVIRYRDNLVTERRIPRNKCSILVVYGRDEKGTLRNSVKGSDDASMIRLISANALFQLVKLAEEASAVKMKQITTLLRPRDYFVLDNLVELVFPETDDDIDAVEDDETDNTMHVQDADRTSDVDHKMDEPRVIKVFKNPVVVVESIQNDVELLHLKYKDVYATGYETNDGFVVIEGAQISREETNSCPGRISEIRKVLIEEGIIQDNVLKKSVKFSSSSTAAGCVIGGSASGPEKWRTEQGVSYKK